jgi:hypothetical protein
MAFSDLLFNNDTPPQAPKVLPPDSALSRNGILLYDTSDDGPQPGSSRTRVDITVTRDRRGIPAALLRQNSIY